MDLSEILPQLQAWLPPEDHKERTIKGGAKWFYLPHQAIREHLDRVCPGEWSTEYTGPVLIDGEPVYHCKLTICGVTRTGIGDKSSEPSNYGTAAIRSFRKAFTDACEQFGIGAYLDEQNSKELRNKFITYMHQKGDGRALSFARENNWIEGNLSTTGQKQTRARAEQQQNRVKPGSETISDAQAKRLWAIALKSGYTAEGAKALIERYGFDNSKAITLQAYNTICSDAESLERAQEFNQKAQQLVSNGAGTA